MLKFWTSHKVNKFDLPLLFRYTQAKRHYSISDIVSLADLREVSPELPEAIIIKDKGILICIGNNEMIYDGFCESRSRHKWRYPLACGKIDEYTHKNQFSPSKYGRVIYTKPDWDLRLLTPIPRGTKKWKETYKTRTCSEWINNRILNDYKLHQMQIRGKKRYSFFTMMIGINIHLDDGITKCPPPA